MPSSNKFKTIVVLLLIVGNLFFGGLFVVSLAKQRQLEVAVSASQTDAKVLSFARLFMDKVLLGEGEVSFDDRLELENSVRAINDQEIFGAWQAFTKAVDQSDVQRRFYDLFSLLLAKI